VYPVRMKKDLRGPAFFIVPISESPVDRAVFNGIVRSVLGDDSIVETQEQLRKVCRIKYHNESQIVELLARSKLMVHDPPSVGELQAIEDYIAKHFRWSPDDEKPVGIGDY